MLLPSPFSPFGPCFYCFFLIFPSAGLLLTKVSVLCICFRTTRFCCLGCLRGWQCLLCTCSKCPPYLAISQQRALFSRTLAWKCVSFFLRVMKEQLKTQHGVCLCVCVRVCVRAHTVQVIKVTNIQIPKRKEVCN